MAVLTTPTRRRVLVVAVPLLLMVIGCGALALVQLVVRTSTTGQVTLAPASRLVVDNPAGAIDVVAGAGPIRVASAERWTWSRPAVTAAVQDDIARVGTGCPVVQGWGGCQVDLRVVVPEGTAVTVNSSAGPVSVRGISGGVDAGSSGDGVVLADLSGPVTAHSSAGSVDASGLRSSSVDVRSSGGGVRLRFVDAPTTVVATSSADDVEVDVPTGSGPYAVNAESSSGSRSVDVPTDPGAARTVTARSSGGSVTVRATDP